MALSKKYTATKKTVAAAQNRERIRRTIAEGEERERKANERKIKKERKGKKEKKERKGKKEK